MKRRILALALILMVLQQSSGLASNGYRIFGVQGARATAQGEAFVARADDPSAIAFNPAGLTQLKGTYISGGSTILQVSTKRTSPGAVTSDYNIDEINFAPNFYLTSDLNREGIAVGIGITAPFGLSSRWSETGFSRYVTTMSSLKVINVNPAFAYKVNSNFSIGAGISYYYSEATLKSQIDYGFLIGAPGTLDGSSVLNGKGRALGYNLGTIYKIDEKNSIGASFRSPFTITYRGTSEFGSIPAFRNLGSVVFTRSEADIHFPAIATIGYAHMPNKKLKLEFDLDWTRWQSLDVLAVVFEDPGIADTSYVYEWKNAFAAKTGLEYNLSDNLALRLGYVFSESAVPEHTFRPSLPDTDKHLVTAGFGLKKGNWTTDVSGELLIYRDRTIDNNVDSNETTTGSSIDGTYESFGWAFSAGVTYKF